MRDVDGSGAGRSQRTPGDPAARLLAPGVALFAADETMLEGWELQQRSRMLSGLTIERRLLTVRRFVSFTNDYPWRWTPGDVEAWTAEMVSAGMAHSTVRNYQMAVALFCGYLSDARYQWHEVCERHFGDVPVQVFHEWNTVIHRADYEGRPGNRPLSREELQAFFDYCDQRVGQVRARGRKGWLATFRDATLFKTIYAWGLRRREAAKRRSSRLSTGRRMPRLPSSVVTGLWLSAMGRRCGAARRGAAPC